MDWVKRERDQKPKADWEAVLYVGSEGSDEKKGADEKKKKLRRSQREEDQAPGVPGEGQN